MIVFFLICLALPVRISYSKENDFQKAWQKNTFEEKCTFILGYSHGVSQACTTYIYALRGKLQNLEKLSDICVSMFVFESDDEIASALTLLDYAYLRKKNNPLSPSHILFISKNNILQQAKKIIDADEKALQIFNDKDSGNKKIK